MKKFRRRLLLFLSVPLLIVLTECILPPQTFTFREWEALANYYPYFAYGDFYPDQQISMTEYGDLGRHTPYEIPKQTTWKTDALGYRNEKYIVNPDIILTGDSFFAGSSLTQDSIVGYQLQRMLDTIRPGSTVYNMAPEGFEKLNYYLRSGIFQKPKIILFEMLERNIPQLYTSNLEEGLSFKNRLRNRIINFLPYQVPMYMDRIIKLSLLRYVSAKINPAEWKNHTASAVALKKENLLHPKMLFYKNGAQDDNDRPEVYSNAVTVLRSYKTYCEKRNIQFIFVALPDKETVYYDQVDKDRKQPVFLFKLDSILRKNNISTVDVLTTYNQYRNAKPGEVLYQYDDTHWNAAGVRIATQALAGKIVSLSAN